jgi:hypothetical protein
MMKCSYCGAEYPDDALTCAIDNRPLQRFVEAPPPEPKPPKQHFQPAAPIVVRGDWLSMFLIINFIASIYYFCTFLSGWEQMSTAMPAWALVASRIVVFLRPASVIAIWLWSRLGVVVYTILSAISGVESLALGQVLPLINFVGIIILVALVREKWRYMSWGISRHPSVPQAELREVPEW